MSYQAPLIEIARWWDPPPRMAVRPHLHLHHRTRSHRRDILLPRLIPLHHLLRGTTRARIPLRPALEDRLCVVYDHLLFIPFILFLFVEYTLSTVFIELMVIFTFFFPGTFYHLKRDPYHGDADQWVIPGINNPYAYLLEGKNVRGLERNYNREVRVREGKDWYVIDLGGRVNRQSRFVDVRDWEFGGMWVRFEGKRGWVEWLRVWRFWENVRPDVLEPDGGRGIKM